MPVVSRSPWRYQTVVASPVGQQCGSFVRYHFWWATIRPIEKSSPTSAVPYAADFLRGVIVPITARFLPTCV